MENRKPHKLEHKIHGTNRIHFESDHKCYYFMEKLSEGFSASDENQLIYNFKKPINRKGFSDWSYRNTALNRFIKDLCNIKIRKKGYITVVPAPTSKTRTSKDWNDRIDKVVEGWSECNSNIKVEYAIDMIRSIPSSHQDGGTRNPEEIKKCLKFDGFKNEPSEIIIIVDDVYTTGGHFKAFRDFILEKEPKIKDVIGLFWALHMWDIN